MKNKFLAIFKNKFILSPIICVTVFSLALLTDLLTKGLIVSKLLPNVGDSKRIIPGFISFIYVKNKGAAWGIFQNGTIFLSIISILGTIVLITFYILRLKKAGKRASILLAITMGLLIAGALGNLVDRLAFGYVRDFINFDFISFPVFNFADAFLTIGIILLIVYIFFVYSKETPDEPIFKKKTNAVEDQSNKEKEDVNAHEGDDKDER